MNQRMIPAAEHPRVIDEGINKAREGMASREQDAKKIIKRRRGAHKVPGADGAEAVGDVDEDEPRGWGLAGREEEVAVRQDGRGRAEQVNRGGGGFGPHRDACARAVPVESIVIREGSFVGLVVVVIIVLLVTRASQMIKSGQSRHSPRLWVCS